jgi:hypothetical protein
MSCFKNTDKLICKYCNNKESSANLTVSSPTLLQIAKVRYRDLLVKIYSLDSNARQFFFEPLVLLDRSSVTLMKNGFFKSDVLRFTIQMWNQERLTSRVSVNGHTTLNAPGLVRSPKFKQRRVPLVLGWVTAWEYGMLLAYINILFYSMLF